jgi:hypothetical protein
VILIVVVCVVGCVVSGVDVIVDITPRNYEVLSWMGRRTFVSEQASCVYTQYCFPTEITRLRHAYHHLSVWRLPVPSSIHVEVEGEILVDPTR